MDDQKDTITETLSSNSPESGNLYLSENSSSTCSDINIGLVSISPTNLKQQPLINQTEENNLKRKRKRLTISCLTCRKRKIKCDRQKPCSSCVKNNVPAQLCLYDESPWVSSLIKDNKMTDELLSLKQENEHLTGLLKMNEQELTNLKNLLVDLKIDANESRTDIHDFRPGQLGSRRQRLDEAKDLLQHSMLDRNDKTKREDFLMQQPINIGQFTCFKQTRFLVKIFGPSSWQNFVLDDIKTSYMLDTCIPYIMDLISKNERRIEQLKIIKLRLFNETKIDEQKLKEIETYLGDYDIVVHNIEFFISIHKSGSFMTYIDDDKLINEFHSIIKRHPTGKKCHIDIELNSPDSYIDLANLASLLLILRISVITQDLDFESDKDERMVAFAAHLFSSMMILEQPTMPAIRALAIFQSYHLYNPLDFGSEILPHGTSRDWSMCLLIAVNSALKLGLHTKEVPSQYDKSHYNYISPHHLREFWRCIIYMDFVTSFQSGLPFAMAGYCDFTGTNEESIILTKIDEDPPEFSDIICHQRLSILRSVAMKFGTTNQNQSKMSSKKDLDRDIILLKRFVLETKSSNLSLLKVLDPFDRVLLQDLLVRLTCMDVLISVLYTLYLSFSDHKHILNSNVDKMCFLKVNQHEHFKLLKRYYNSSLIFAVFGLRLSAFFLERVYSDPFWSKNLTLQFLTLKHIKQICLKSCSSLLILLIRNTKAHITDPTTDRVGVYFESNFNQKDGKSVDIFHMPFDDLEKLAFSTEEKYECYNFENNNILNSSMELTNNIFKTISSKKSFLTIDRKWYISYELCYISILFSFQNCPIVKKKFNCADYTNQQDFENFKKFYNVDDINHFRNQNYQKNKNEIMKIHSLLN